MCESKCVVVLLGLPGSGKTTIAKKLRENAEKSKNVKVFSFDDIVSLNEQAKFVSSENMKDSRKALLNTVEDYVSNNDNFTVVVDDNNYYRSMRHEYYRLAAKYRTGFCLVFLKCEINLAVENNARRLAENRVPEEVIHRMAERFEPPSEKWEENILIIHINEIDAKLNDVWTLIQAADANPVLSYDLLELRMKQREASRLINSENAVHVADQILRKEIKKILSENKAESKTLAPRLNDGRKVLLQRVKSQDILLGNEEDAENQLAILLRDFMK